MGKISKKVLKKIEKENIKPIGKCSFVLKNSFLWLLFGLTILFGSIGFAISLYLFELSDIFNIVLSINDFTEIVILSIPFVWIILTILFVLVAYLNFKYTERGYRLSFVKIIFLNILCILVLGSLIHATHVSDVLNRIFSENIPSYNENIDPRYKVWSNPEQGYIAGTILSIDGNSIEIKDLESNNWIVDISSADIRRSVDIVIDEKIKIVGNIVEESNFKALEILPWEGKRKNLQENHF